MAVSAKLYQESTAGARTKELFATAALFDYLDQARLQLLD